MSKPYTKEEVLKLFMDQTRTIANYWSKVEGRTEKEKIEGAIFTLLNSIDGMGYPFVAMDLVLRPHPDDKNYHIENGDDYYEDGMAINDCVYLHELFYEKQE